MKHNVALRLAVLIAVFFGTACGHDPTQPDFEGKIANASLARAGTPGIYELLFLSSSLQPVTMLTVGGPELVLGAHIASTSGVAATGGTVAFEYCSRKGRPNDISNADEAPREECRAGTASWARLGSVAVNAAGNAYFNFGIVQIPRTVGFRFRYSPQRGGTIAGSTSADLNFTWVVP